MKKIYILLAMLPLLFPSCTPDDRALFAESAANRMDATLKQHQAILTGADNGWVMEYFSHKKQSYGGYTLFLRFEENDKVTVASELAQADQTETSLYQLISDNGPVLTFNTLNKLLHYFSTPKNPDGIGPIDSGMGGDYEFIVIESTPEKVTLKGKRTGNRIILRPIAADTTWPNLMRSYQAAAEKIKGTKYSVNMGEVAGTASSSYRTITMVYPGASDAIETTTASYRVLPSDEIEFYQPVIVAGKEVHSMKFTSNEEGGIIFTDAATGLTLTEQFPILNEALINGNWFFSYSQLAAYGKQRWDLAEAGLATIDEKLYYAALSKGKQYLFGCMTNETAKLYRGSLDFSYELIETDRIKLTYRGTGSGNGRYYYRKVPNFPELVNLLNGEFRLTADNRREPTYFTLQDVAKPENSYTLSSIPILWPYRD